MVKKHSQTVQFVFDVQLNKLDPFIKFSQYLIGLYD